ncbi:hypothetical protein SAMN04487989_1011099 [Bizionia echini]|uniref:DoxX-like family protein n=1 Tax=Bizionia echini TaxID=649333 RepID=A0A1I4ZUP4_9FLAO|nr:hypothetical protein [Bizionia echini]MBP94083.1 hypothetical protein [Flavobacteriaceae bacterium]SFN53996.1 hypothetical protein SAMN04487989_1011099 [Bizionia echini]|tara:strand:- start:764 stop:1186 length:423 start_codon:yes stop_codon:yes gene_type:complete
MIKNVKPPTTFWLVAIFAIVWNLIEIYFSSVELDFLQANSTVEEFERIQSLPFWYGIVFLIALFSEMLGSFMLFMRKKIAVNFFGIALVTLICIELYWLLVFDIKKQSIVFSIIIPLLVILVAGFLYVYSKKAKNKGWLK